MSKEKLIRSLCIALVGTVLSLALILVVAFSNGMLADTPPEESEDPHFRPFFPEGSVDLGDVMDTPDLDGTLEGGGFPSQPGSGDDFPFEGGDGTMGDLPFDPSDMTLSDWESGMEWPTLPPSIMVDPNEEWFTLPEDWDTLPEDWDTLPGDWGGDGDFPYDPDDLSDILTGLDGSLGLPPGALAAGVASQLTVMEIYAEKSETLYLKIQSFGGYTGQGWNETAPYGYTINTYGYSANYLPHYIKQQMGYTGYSALLITPYMEVRVNPYYLTADGNLDLIQGSDVRALGSYGEPYVLYYDTTRPQTIVPFKDTKMAQYEADYADFVRYSYLDVDDTTLSYMKLIIEEQGFDPSDPDIVEKVATYIQNAATYNLQYDQNLDREPNVALAFLGAYKEGVCRHYATAATLLYRALGIPARYTVGFAADVEGDATTTVKGSDAHAWVEVYEYGFGWRYVEVTGTTAQDPGHTPGDDPETIPGTETEPVIPPDDETTLGDETIPEDDTTPGDETIPEDQTGSDITEPDPDDTTEPETTPSYSYGDLMAGADGNLKPSTSIPTAVWNGALLYLNADRSDRVLLKLKSMGNYTGQGFDDVKKSAVEAASTAYMTGLYLSDRGAQETYLLVETLRKTYVAPYYVSTNQPDLRDVIIGEASVSGGTATDYTVAYYPDDVGYSSPAYLTEADKELYARMAELYTAVDDETKQAILFLLMAESWVQEDASVVIPAVARYLQERYSLIPEPNAAIYEANNGVIAFLDQYREGNVRHFAAAATLIYRTLGIPARYTVGYLGETVAGERTTVQGRDAYAWVEVFVEGIGWVVVDVAEGAVERPPEPEQKPTVTLEPTSLKVLYTGSPITHNGQLTGFEKYEKLGYTYVAETQGSRTDYGRTDVIITSVTLYDPNGVDVTGKFDIVTKPGTLTVCIAELFLVSEGKTKTYDGIPLVTDTVTLAEGSLPDGYTLEIIPAAGQTNVGVGYAAFSVKIRYENNGFLEDVTSYFIVRKQYGTMTVTPAALTVKADDAEKAYDGTPLTSNGITITSGSLAHGDRISAFTVEGSRTNVGRSENVITDLVILNSAGENVTLNYTIETLTGTLKVTVP